MSEVSEVTELTNEQLLIQLVKEAGIGCDKCIDPLYDEVLCRLSTQGAGPRCPKCGSEEIKLTGRACAFEDGVQIGIRCPKCDFKSIPKTLSDFAQFFRAPSDPHEHGREVRR